MRSGRLFDVTLERRDALAQDLGVGHVVRAQVHACLLGAGQARGQRAVLEGVQRIQLLVQLRPSHPPRAADVATGSRRRFLGSDVVEHLSSLISREKVGPDRPVQRVVPATFRR